MYSTSRKGTEEDESLNREQEPPRTDQYLLFDCHHPLVDKLTSALSGGAVSSSVKTSVVFTAR